MIDREIYEELTGYNLAYISTPNEYQKSLSAILCMSDHSHGFSDEFQRAINKEAKTMLEYLRENAKVVEEKITFEPRSYKRLVWLGEE